MNLSAKKIEETRELQLQFEKRGGILPVVVQESSTNQILMVASVNEQALRESIKQKLAAFWSTSRNELWIKGLTSGNKLHLDDILIDCDQDALIYKVTLEGDGACHTISKTGKHRTSCFYRKLDLTSNELRFLEE